MKESVGCSSGPPAGLRSTQRQVDDGCRLVGALSLLVMDDHTGNRQEVDVNPQLRLDGQK